MVGKSWDVFTKRELVEKHISGIKYENPWGATAPAFLCRRPYVEIQTEKLPKNLFRKRGLKAYFHVHGPDRF